MRIGHGHQGRIMHSHSTDKGHLYKQLVEYCCGSLSSSLVNIQLMFLLDIHPKRFIDCAAIRYQSSGCHNMGQVRNLSTSTLIFDISQFFPSLNHCLLTLILGKAGFDLRVVKFFSDYLIGRKTQYFWNSFSSLFFNVNVRVGQGSALSPILSALYLTSFLHILENYLKNLKIPVSILSFVDNGLLVT